MSDNQYSREKLSLVAFYGKKPTELTNLISKLQQHLARHKLIQHNFIPYQLEQVHGTVIGCEGLATDSGIISKWFYELRQEKKQIDISGLIHYLQHQVSFPITIGFGGYNRHQNYSFLSRKQHPYLRSCQLQPREHQTIPIVMGWSLENNKITLAIDHLRRDLQQFNLLHKYHQNPDAIDNDFYLRLGTIDQQLTVAARNAIATEIQNVLEAQAPLSIPINLTDLALVEYQDILLTPATTKVIPMKKK